MNTQYPDPNNNRTNYVQLPDQPPAGLYNPPVQQQGYPQFEQQYPQLPSYPQYPNNAQYPNPSQYPNLPPQYPNYPQYPPQQYQGPNFGQPGQPGQPGYISPAQIYTGNAMPGNVVGLSKQQIMAEIRNLDQRLDSSGYRCYLVWLYFVVVMACLDMIQTIIYAINIGEVGGYLPSFICAIWILYQSLLEIDAISKKDPAKAGRALTFMTIFSVLNLATIIVFGLWLGNLSSCFYCDDDYDFYLMQAYLITLLSIYTICLLTHLFITLLGGVKVLRILKQRQILQNTLSNIH